MSNNRTILATLVALALLASGNAAAQPRRAFVVEVVNGTGITLVVDCNGDTSHPIVSNSYHTFRYQSARTELAIDCVAWDLRGNVVDRTALQIASDSGRGEWRVGGQSQAPPRPAPTPRRSPPRRQPSGHGQPGHSH